MFDLETFVADCRAALGESTPEVAVRELVARAMAQPVRWSGRSEPRAGQKSPRSIGPPSSPS